MTTYSPVAVTALIEAAEDVLNFGDHDGPCEFPDGRGCVHHIEASTRRASNLESALLRCAEGCGVNLSYGMALEALKSGKRVKRSAWRYQEYIYLNKGSFDGTLLGFAEGEQPALQHGSTIDGLRLGLFKTGDKGTVTRLPNINLLTVSGTTLICWTASQVDTLAEDWLILD